MLFQKKEEAPETPRLLGEDFDIFPDLGDRPKPEPMPEKSEEPEEPEVPEPEPEPTPFQKKVAAIDEKRWKTYQIIGGIVLGVLSGLALTVFGRIETIARFNLIIAVVLALLVPNLFERYAARKIPTVRIWLIITLGVLLALYVFYGLVINPEFFTPAK